MKSLLSATAAIALLVAAGQAGAQTAADHPSDASATQSSTAGTGSMNNPATTTEGAPSSDSAAPAPNQPAADQSTTKSTTAENAQPQHRSGYSGREAAENRREAKITNNLNQQELAKVDKSSPAMSGASSTDTSQKMNSDWHTGHKNTKAQPNDNAGSGSSSGPTVSPGAGSDADVIGQSQSKATPQTSGDKAAAPDSAVPESVSGASSAGGQ